MGTTGHTIPENLPESRLSFSLLGYRTAGEKTMRTRPVTYEEDINGCHICTSHAPNTRGYPTLMKSGKKWTIARDVYSQLHGEIPAGMLVCHTCDNRMCINPDHLFVGTPKDNMTDMIQKGRKINLYGEQNPAHKFTEKIVLEIVSDLKTMTCSQIGRSRNISIKTVNDIKNGRRWGWLTSPQGVLQ